MIISIEDCAVWTCPKSVVYVTEAWRLQVEYIAARIGFFINGLSFTEDGVIFTVSWQTYIDIMRTDMHPRSILYGACCVPPVEYTEKIAWIQLTGNQPRASAAVFDYNGYYLVLLNVISV